MSNVSRRNLLRATAFVSGALAFGVAPNIVSAESTTSGGYVPKPLPFNPGKLIGISEKLIVSHHDKNYAGAVKRLASIQEKIRRLPGNAAPFEMGSLKREELIAMNSMILHEYYFENLGGDGKIGCYWQNNSEPLWWKWQSKMLPLEYRQI